MKKTLVVTLAVLSFVFLAGFVSNDLIATVVDFGIFVNNEEVAYVSTFDKSLGQRYKYIDKEGNKIFDKEFSAVRQFSEGYAAVAKSGFPNSRVFVKWSYIDKSGEFVTDLEFEEAYPFEYGHAIIGVDGKFGVINNKFEFVVPCEYDSISGNAQFGFTCKLGDKEEWFTFEI